MTNHDEGRVCVLCKGNVASGERYRHGYGVCVKSAAPRDPFEIVDEWRRGCSNTTQHYRDGVPTSPNAEACPDCTAAAMRAVARWVDRCRAAPKPDTELVDAMVGVVVQHVLRKELCSTSGAPVTVGGPTSSARERSLERIGRAVHLVRAFLQFVVAEGAS